MIAIQVKNMKNMSQCPSKLILSLLSLAFIVGCAANGDHQPGSAPAGPVGQPGPPKAASPVKGTSDSGGGDWFVKALPILKIKFPESDGYVEGVQYKKIKLDRCVNYEKNTFTTGHEVDLYFPGKNFEAIKVRTLYSQILCSHGVVESNPDKALQILVNNDETNRATVYDGHIMASKIYGGPMAVGNFLVIKNAPNKLAVFGNVWMLNIPLDPNFFSADQALASSGETDEIFVPSDIKQSKRVYFGNNPNGIWRLLLPVALEEGVIPLQELSLKLTLSYQQKDEKTLDLLNNISLPKGFPDGVVEPWTTVAQIWSTLERTSDNVQLRNHFYSSYSLNLKTENRDHSYLELKELSGKFDFIFSPTIELNDITHAAYHSFGHRIQFAIPLLNPTWRVVADMIHEMTHAIQTYSGSNSSDQTFRNEIEAHRNERAYLNDLSKNSDVLKSLIKSYNYIVAAEVPKVRFADSIVKSPELTLCDEIISSYGLDRSQISEDFLKRYDCR